MSTPDLATLKLDDFAPHLNTGFEIHLDGRRVAATAVENQCAARTGQRCDLVTLYQDQLFALVVRMVPDRDQASDCVQEAFFSAFRNLRSFRGGSVKSWLNRICVNAAMDTQRARKRRPVQPYPELDDESWQPPTGPEADPERTAMLSERTRALSAALASITDDQRTAIVLFDVEGYDYAEIAEMTNVSLGTVKSRIHRGRLALRELLEDRMELFRG